jgi:hypothetical protein
MNKTALLTNVEEAKTESTPHFTLSHLMDPSEDRQKMSIAYATRLRETETTSEFL